MTELPAYDRALVVRWVRTVPAVFLVVGLGFGSWLSRLPAVRDHLGASATEMSVYGLCLALGGLAGLSLSGRVVHRFGPRDSLAVGTVVTAVALPSAAAIIMSGAAVPGLAVLFAYGFAFSVCDVAMNVSGANAEAAFGKPRMPLMHAGYSLGAVAATGVGALAELLDVPVPLHFAIVMAVSALALLVMLRLLPRDEAAVRVAAEQHRGGGSAGARSPDAQAGAAPHNTALTGPPTGAIPVIESAAGQQPAFTTMTGSIPIVAPEASRERLAAAEASAPVPADAADASRRGTAAGTAGTADRPYSPWRDRRILLIGLITLSFGLYEGTASDWLPLALVDGRGFSNQLGATMLSVFFAAVMIVRIIGSLLITRFGRVAVLRCSAVFAAVGVVATILLPGTAGAIIGVLAWGIGSGLGWPIAISAAADRIDTAARDVAAVSALGYGSMLVGPMAFGFLGEHIGLLTGFWALMPFAVYVAFAAGAARSR